MLTFNIAQYLVINMTKSSFADYIDVTMWMQPLLAAEFRLSRRLSLPATSQWIAPAQACESSEVVVVRVHLRLVLDREGGNMSIGGEIRTGAGIHEKAKGDLEMTRSGKQESNAGA